MAHYLVYLLVFDRIHDTMYLNKMSRTSGRKTGPHLVGLLPISYFLVSFDHRSKCHLKVQSCLKTEYAEVFLDEPIFFFS